MALIRQYSDDRLGWAHSDIFQAGLDPFTGWVYMNLASRADSTGKAWPKQSTIAADCGMSERQVRNCIAKLIEQRLLVVLEKSGLHGGRRAIYYLATRNEWVGNALNNDPQPAPPAGLQDANRNVMPVQPAPPAGSHIKELNPKNSIQEKAQAPASCDQSSAKSKVSKKKKAADPKGFLPLFAPDEFRHSDEFVAAWDNWGQNRIENGSPLTERAAKQALNKLAKFPIKTAIEALERATLSCWTGVFPESIAKGGKPDRFSEASGEQPRQDFGW